MLKTLDVQKGDYIKDPSLVLDLPLYRLDGQKFTSRDAYGSLCTVTGALWRPDGRLFDGADDYIIVGSNPAFTSDTKGTISLWVKGTDKRASQLFNFAKLSTGIVDEFKFQFDTRGGLQKFSLVIIDNTVTTHDLRTATGTILPDVWYLVTIVSTGSAHVFYINGASKAITETTGTADGTWFSALTTDADQITIGALPRSGGYVGDFKGNTGEVWVYNRGLSPLEIQHNYLATKWRYQ